MTQISSRAQLLTLFLIVAPVAIYVILRLNPPSNQMWGTSIFHFYVVGYTSLIALIVAIMIFSGIGAGQTRPLTVAMLFLTMAGFFVIHGTTTPGVLLGANQAIGWAAQLSLSAGALLATLTRVDWKPETKAWISRNRHRMWLALLAVYAFFLWVAFTFPTTLASLQAAMPRTLLVLLTIGAYLWSAWSWWQSYRRQPARLSLALAIGLCWLAMAQVSQYEAPQLSAPWWMYHLLMLGAFVIAMRAILLDYEEVRDFHLTRYFAATGVLVTMPLVALMTEYTVNATQMTGLRWPIFMLSLLALIALLVVLLLIVRRAQRIINERTAALQAEKQWRADMTSLIVHDLKTPLTSIFLNFDLMIGGRLGPISPTQKQRLEYARRSAENMVGLIDNLLDVEKIEAGSLDLMRMPCDLKSLLTNSIDAVRGLSDEQKIALSAAIAEDLPTVTIDATLMRRVMQNLLGNAIKFTPENGHITVEARVDHEAVVIRTSDSGPGVPADERDHIFEKFQQAKNTVRGGYGLGLTLCKLVVEAHGGQIWVEDAPGGGSSFVFSLPVQAA
jgi:signal transduction histidine kinase